MGEFHPLTIYLDVLIQQLSNRLQFFLHSGFLNSFEELQAEECGILNGCENGRCVRVQEGYTCDCFDGYHLDMAKMTCVGEDNVLLHLLLSVCWFTLSLALRRDWR